jgi:hypothetical protein
MSDAPAVEQIPARTCIKRKSGLAARGRQKFRSRPFHLPHRQGFTGRQWPDFKSALFADP